MLMPGPQEEMRLIDAHSVSRRLPAAYDMGYSTDPLSGSVWPNETYSCYGGNRQTSTSPSDGVLCLMKITHASRILIRHSTLSDGDVKVCLSYDCVLWWIGCHTSRLRSFHLLHCSVEIFPCTDVNVSRGVFRLLAGLVSPTV